MSYLLALITLVLVIMDGVVQWYAHYHFIAWVSVFFMAFSMDDLRFGKNFNLGITYKGYFRKEVIEN